VYGGNHITTLEEENVHHETKLQSHFKVGNAFKCI
jgi:hypothetical protein